MKRDVVQKLGEETLFGDVTLKYSQRSCLEILYIESYHIYESMNYMGYSGAAWFRCWHGG